ncbi:MAG: M3 family oligoendopeptidase [Niabella sp.]
MMNATADIEPLPRKYLPADFVVTDWPALEPFFKGLLARELTSLQDLHKWLADMSELEAVISEDACWRQIKMTCNTEDPALAESFNYFMMEIQPNIQPYLDQLNRKLADCPYTAELTDAAYIPYLRNIRKNISLFREENIPLQSELAVSAQRFGVISGSMTITVNDREYTLQQAAKFLEDSDRGLREQVYRQISERRLQEKGTLNGLYDELISKRHQMALNAGYPDYAAYRFVELGRFDYTKEDCFLFHEAVKEHVLPLVNDIYVKKKSLLELETLRPWDVDAQPEGIKPLHPFTTGEELLQKAIACFEKLNPFFAQCLVKMREMGHLDLESRKGKAPGGYNCPLAESGAPFIFMNAAGTLNDVITMVHEGGHAIHSFLSHPLPLTGFKEYPMEIAEVASMSMELFSMEEWGVFFPDEAELKRAKEQELERVITLFPWIATIDKFQHWVYENPNHTHEERKENWLRILNEFTPEALDVSGLEEYRAYSWQRQLHLYEVPFYYIEYGIAQLGAIGMWQQFKQNRAQALANYMAGLSLGGTRTLPELFAAAGLRFDLSPNHIQNLMNFVKKEMDVL